MQKWLDKVQAERIRQDKLWGEQNHALERWYTILGEEFGEVGKEICELGYAETSEYKKGLKAYHTNQLKEELVQVAAVCVAILECIERTSAEIQTQSEQSQQQPQQQLELSLSQDQKSEET